MRKRIATGALVCFAACGAAVLVGQGFGQQPVVVEHAPGQQAYGFALFSADDGNPHREAELNGKITQLIQQYTAAKDEEARRSARDKLQSALGDLFDLRQKEREDEIKEIESRVAKLRETLKKRESKRQELIEHHLTTVINDAEGLGWGGDGQGRDVLYYRTPTTLPAAPGRAMYPPGAAPRRE